MGKLSSELTNRIELWNKVKVESKLGNTIEDMKIVRLWSKIIYYGGKVKEGQANTDYSDTNYKIKIRKSNRVIKETQWIIYKSQKFEIKYIIPDYKNNDFLFLYCNQVKE